MFPGERQRDGYRGPAGRRAQRLARGAAGLLLALVAVLGAPAEARAQQGLPVVMAGLPVGGLVPAGGPAPVTVRQLVVSVAVEAGAGGLALLPPRVGATVEARYVLRLEEGNGAQARRVALRFLAVPETAAQLDGRPAELYPATYPRLEGTNGTPGGHGGEAPAAVPSPQWVDPLTGRLYQPGNVVPLASPQALGIDVDLRPGAEHELRLRFSRVPLGWDATRYLSPAYQLVLPVHPGAWAGFGPVEVHAGLPPGYVAALAGAGEERGTGRLQPYGYRRWERPPAEVRVATLDTAGMWWGAVTRRRHVLWLLALTWLLFVGLRAAAWRVARRRDGWAWAALPALLALPAAAGWVSWQSLRVPLWGYPFSLLQYAVWIAGALYVAGRVVGDLTGFLWLRWRYRRAAAAGRERGGGASPLAAGGLTGPGAGS